MATAAVASGSGIWVRARAVGSRQFISEPLIGVVGDDDLPRFLVEASRAHRVHAA